MLSPTFFLFFEIAFLRFHYICYIAKLIGEILNLSVRVLEYNCFAVLCCCTLTHTFSLFTVVFYSPLLWGCSGRPNPLPDVEKMVFQEKNLQQLETIINFS